MPAEPLMPPPIKSNSQSLTVKSSIMGGQDEGGKRKGMEAGNERAKRAGKQH